MQRRTLIPLSVACSLIAGRAAAGDYELGGKLHALYGVRANKVDCSETPSCVFPLAEERFELKFSGSSQAVAATSFQATVDFVADQVKKSAYIDPRELYADVTLSSVTIRAGRQILTWGIGDYVFLNDIFPKNWESFFLGRPPEYLKEPSNALRVIAPHVDAIVSPVFQGDVLPGPDRFSYSDPLPANVPRVTTAPTPKFENVESALRLSVSAESWDIAWYGSHGFYKSPSFAPGNLAQPPSELRFSYPRLNTVGFSIQGPVLGGVVGVEASYYDSQDDRHGTNPFIDNSEYRALAAFSHELWTDASLGLQVFFQGMRDHDAYVRSLPQGMNAVDKLRWTGTARFTQFLLRQLLQFNVFAFVGLTEKDSYIIPSLSYAVTDALSADIIGNVFLGPEDSQFGRFRRNSNVAIGLHYGF